MTTRQKILDLFLQHPGKKLTSNEIAGLLKRTPKKTIWNTIKSMLESGALIRTPNPMVSKEPLYSSSEAQSHSRLTPGSLPTYSRFTPDLLPDYLSLLFIYIVTHISNSNTSIKNSDRNPIPPAPEFGVELHHLIDRFLNSEGRELISSVPDSVVKRIHSIVEDEILPLLRTPKESLDPPFKTESLDPPAVLAEPSAPIAEAPCSEPVPVSVAAAQRNMERFKTTPKKPRAKTPPAETPYKKARSKKLAQKEERIESDPFNVHIRYFGMDPEQRNFEFARAWMKIMNLFFKGFKPSASWSKAMNGLSYFKESGNFRLYIRNARIEADLLKIRYEDYMVGIAEDQIDDNAKSGIDRTPELKKIAGPSHVAAVRDHIQLGLKNKILITIADVKNSGNVDFLLPANYSESMPPEQRQQCDVFYQDHLFPEIERVASLTGHRLHDLVSHAIAYGLLPQAWPESPETQKRLIKLRGYRYSTPTGFDSLMIFRSAQE